MRADGSRPGLGLAAFLAVTLVVSRGLAEPAISLRWLGAGPESGCLGQGGLERAVSESLGRDAFSPPPAEREVVVWVGARAGVGFRAVIRVRDGARVLGERELVSEGASCSTLDEPLAFAVALMVDSEALPPAPLPEEPAPERGREERSPAPPFARFELELGLLGVTGVLPEPTLGLELGGELRVLRWLGLRARAAGLLPRALELGPARARFGLFLAGAAVCPAWRSGDFAAVACVGFDWGALTLDTVDFESNTSDSRRFLATSALAEARFRVRKRLWLAATGGVLVPHDRERFTYRLQGEPHTAFQSSALCPRVGLGIGFEL